MGKLDGKVAVVTGASKGIGASIAEWLGREGASVIVNYASSKEGADRAVAKIVAAGGKAKAVQADVSDETQIARLLAETKSTYGDANILVNNAGVFEFAPLEQITPATFHRQFGLNVLGLLLTTKAFAEGMGKGDSIINISSMAARSPMATGSVYGATKGAVDVITMSLSKELGPRGIRINSLCPGLVETEGIAAMGFPDAMLQGIIAQTPLGRLGQPDDIGKIAVFLASDESGWVTGQMLYASGGVS